MLDETDDENEKHLNMHVHLNSSARPPACAVHVFVHDVGQRSFHTACKEFKFDVSEELNKYDFAKFISLKKLRELVTDDDDAVLFEVTVYY